MKNSQAQRPPIPWFRFYSRDANGTPILRLARALYPGFREWSSNEGKFKKTLVRGLYLSILCWAAESAPDGNLGQFSTETLADCWGWEGSGDDLFRALEQSGIVGPPPLRTVTCWALVTGEAERLRGKLLVAAVKERDGAVCAYCGIEAKIVHIDHVIPISRGGQSTLENMVVACRSCNLSKGAKMVAK